MTRIKGFWLGLAAAGMLAGCMPSTASQPPSAGMRFPVYFNEMSADVTPAAAQVIGEAAGKARAVHATAIRLEGRASATGSAEANAHLSERRVRVIAGALEKDGLDPKTFREVDLGQSGSGDPSVAERRVDIVLER